MIEHPGTTPALWPSPNRLNRSRPMDRAVGGKQGEPLDQRCSPDDAIRWIFRIRRWKSYCPGARPAADWQNNESSLHFLEKRFEADVKTDPALPRKCGQLQQSDIGNCQPVCVLARVVDCTPRFSGDLILVKRQPDNDMCIDENHLSSPHSSGETAGETTSPSV